jgi:predicted nucleic acid-binding Zn ribbon protein
MALQPATRQCLSCGKTVKGRADKKFCDDYCRNNYNNELKSDSNNYVRNINNTLRKNRRILEELLPEKEEMVKTTKDKLLQMGFVLKHFTHLYTTKTGKVYYYCYEYGYLPLENDWYLLVRRKEG